TPHPHNRTTLAVPVLFSLNHEREGNRSSQTDVATPILTKSTERGMQSVENYHRIRSVPTIPKTGACERRAIPTRGKKNTDGGGTGGTGGGRGTNTAIRTFRKFKFLADLSAVSSL
ncbi:unnamed protein product, partial [Ectocarpus sp. 4 AP-2014]